MNTSRLGSLPYPQVLAQAEKLDKEEQPSLVCHGLKDEEKMFLCKIVNRRTFLDNNTNSAQRRTSLIWQRSCQPTSQGLQFYHLIREG
jgi:hypothetical protein